MNTAKHTARLYAEAWAQGEAEAYVKAFLEVHETLRAMRNTNLLVQVVNSQLRRMEKDNLTPVNAAREVLATLEHVGSKKMVMAATVDIACNQYAAGTEVTSLRTPSELLG